MPSKSKAQQKFMGMVHAAQKGDLKNPSPEVKKAAKSIKPKTAKDFAATKRKGLPNHVKESTQMPISQNTLSQAAARTPTASLKQPQAPQMAASPQQTIEGMLEAIAKYNEYGNSLRGAAMREIGARIAEIAQVAEQAVMSEADDWFDAHTVKRNMKELQGYAKDFNKLAEEADLMNQRMTALYDDMGRILERYFEIPDLQESLPHGKLGAKDSDSLPKHDLGQGVSSVPTHPLGQGAADLTHKVGAEPDREESDALQECDGEEVTGKTKMLDELTLRAIKAVHERLKRQGKTAEASKFAKLPPHKMKEVVWKLVK